MFLSAYFCSLMKVHRRNIFGPFPSAAIGGLGGLAYLCKATDHKSDQSQQQNLVQLKLLITSIYIGSKCNQPIANYSVGKS